MAHNKDKSLQSESSRVIGISGLAAMVKSLDLGGRNVASGSRAFKHSAAPAKPSKGKG